MKIVEVSGLPHTLHSSIHAHLSTWEGEIDGFIEKYEKSKKKDLTMWNIYESNKEKVVAYLHKIMELKKSPATPE